MHTIIRSYADPELADLLASNRDEVETLISGVPGVHSYVLLRTADGCASVTIGDESAMQASSETAAEYLRSKGATASPPTVTTGEVIAQVGVRATV